MRITDRVRKALGAMTPETVQARIAAVEAEIVTTRAAIVAGEDDLHLAEVMGSGADAAAAKLGALREKYSRLPDALETLHVAAQEATAAKIESDGKAEIDAIRVNLGKLTKPYASLLAAVAQWNTAVTAAGDIGSDGYNGGSIVLHVATSADDRADLRHAPIGAGGIPDLAGYGDRAISMLEKNLREDVQAARNRKPARPQPATSGPESSRHQNALEQAKFDALTEAAKGGDPDARAALALDEWRIPRQPEPAREAPQKFTLQLRKPGTVEETATGYESLYDAADFRLTK